MGVGGYEFESSTIGYVVLKPSLVAYLCIQCGYGSLVEKWNSMAIVISLAFKLNLAPRISNNDNEMLRNLC